ncbi:hypothetical protein E1281_13460 [Actinomadura sp. KC345]|uniref:DUF7064 domain-containing protein n=1 Tax=Actinomadura sp. KC345 TaxID=2530371 RepID=UPI001051B79D|nr:hypothetical protein [Actinomadura sp. KC345]TDC55282.1 hypothetical protein E1281_13460 [Actinomadura sp. KC345]
MSMFVEQIEPHHEYRHRADGDPAYNESTYYNFACPESGVAGWLRVAVQENRPAAQAGVMLFLPGEALFDYRRLSAAPGGLTAGDLTVEIVEPLRRQRLAFDGRLASFADPRVLTTPSSAFREAPRRAVRIDLDVRGQGPPFGTNGDDPANYVEESMALGHFEQFIAMRGTITVDGRGIEVDGRGLRDHSWGPRDWAGPRRYRWAIANLDDGTQVMALVVAHRTGGTTRQAALVKDGALTEIGLDDMRVRWTGDGFGEEVVIALSTPDGPVTLTATATTPHRFFPLRHHRRDDDGSALDTRIGYSAYEFRTGDGRTGLGLVEILDQLADGLPLGMRQAGGTP